ncbi:MAG: carbohydrate kinase family protein [Chloroflexi bacterium]|nr:carbohydrate kinase family protein [Chloroflexota bacterium]
MTPKIEVIGLGALNMDYLYKVERILVDGETVVSEAVSSPGGSAANTIYGLAKLGVKTGFTGVIGGDADGKALLQDFQRVGVDTSQIKVKRKAKTGAVLCLTDNLGQRSLYVAPGANNLLTFDDLDLIYINQAKMLHISSFADERQFQALLKLVKKLSPAVKVSFAPGALHASKELKALAPILSRTHVLFINRNEIKKLTGKDFAAGAEVCLKRGCHIVAVTLGKGESYKNVIATSYIRDAEHEYIIEANTRAKVTEVDTTGAGDAFAAGFLYGLLKGKKLGECGRIGDIVARFCIAKMGARAGLPDPAHLAQRYQELYKKQL